MSKSAAPATSHNRKVSVSGCRARPPPSSTTSVSLCTVRTETRTSLRTRCRPIRCSPYCQGANPPSSGMGTAPRPVNQAAIDHLVMGIDGVEVGDERHRGLRRAHGEHRTCPSGQAQLVPHGHDRLREDVIGIGIARVGKPTVALGVDGFEVHPQIQADSVDTHLLGGHSGPRVARSHEVSMGVEPPRCGIEASADIEPLDMDGTAEGRHVEWPIQHEAGHIVRAVRRLDEPLTIVGRLGQMAIGPRRSEEEVLLADIPLGLQVEGRRPQDERSGNGSLNADVSHLSPRSRMRRGANPASQ